MFLDNMITAIFSCLRLHVLRVKSSKMETILTMQSNPTVGQIVAYNFRAAEVFKKHGIDFCCKGGKLLKDVCSEKNLDQARIEDELAGKFAYSTKLQEDAYHSLPLSELVDHILATHHQYVRESIPVLLGFLDKINKVHGIRHPELADIFAEFAECADELTLHMIKEETILFPAIKKIAECNEAGKDVPAFFFGPLSNPIKAMEQEHAIEGARFERLAQLSNNFTPPDDACTTYRVAYMKLDEFMNDLFVHIHLENNILFPRVSEIGKTMV